MLLSGQSPTLESQAGFASALGERADAAVVAVAAAIEDAGVDSGVLGALGEQLARLLRLLGRLQLAQVALDPRSRGERAPGAVVHQLREDASIGSEHGQPRTLGGAADLGA